MDTVRNVVSNDTGTETRDPDLFVIIPEYNDPDGIRITLNSLCTDVSHGEIRGPRRRQRLASRGVRLSLRVPVERYFEKWNYGPTCGLFVRMLVSEAVSLFDERLISGSDAEFGDRFHRAGRPQAFTDDLIVYHPVRSSVRALIEKNVRIGRGTYQRCHHPDRYGSPLSGLLSPTELLPPYPWTVAARCRGWNELTLSMCIMFYLLVYVLKIATTVGLAVGAIAVQ